MILKPELVKETHVSPEAESKKHILILKPEFQKPTLALKPEAVKKANPGPETRDKQLKGTANETHLGLKPGPKKHTLSLTKLSTNQVNL